MIDIEKVKQTLLEALENAEVIIKNARGDGLHFEAIVISKSFEGKSLLEQHSTVMEPLKELFSTSLHALALKTYTPEKWKKKQKETF